MDRSFGGSTSVMQTPSPLNRKLPVSSSSALAGQLTTKSVRFSPAANSGPTAGASYFNTSSGSPYSAGPPSRLQSFTTPTRSPSARSIPTTPPAQQPSYTPSSTQPLSSFNRPSLTPRQQLTPVGQRVASAAASASSAASLAVDAVKASTPVRLPLGRGEAARRLRINSILLVSWWIASRTAAYSYAAGKLVQTAPGLDVPLHLVESVVYLLLCFNIAESIYRLQQLSGLSDDEMKGKIAHDFSRAPSRPNSSLFATPVRSSPKTRPSAPISPSPRASPGAAFTSAAPPSPFRASSVGKTTPQTPSSAPRSTADVLRRSVFGGASAVGGSPLAKNELATSVAGHSPTRTPLGMSVSINSQEAIDRLLEN